VQRGAGEVTDFEVKVVVQQEIVWFDVAVNHASTVEELRTSQLEPDFFGSWM